MAESMDAIDKLDNINADELKVTETKQIENEKSFLGWLDVKREELPYVGSIYPEHIRFQVRSANAKEIRHFSSMDENNPLSVNEAITYIISNCVRCYAGKVLVDPNKVIYEHQRLFFCLLVHTYTGNTTNLSFDAKCKSGKCGHPQTINVTPYNLQYAELSDKAVSYLNNKTGVFEITTKTLGEYRFRPLTLSEAQDVQDYMLECRKNGSDFETTFVEFAGFLMLDKKDAESMQDVYMKFLKLSSNPKIFSLLKKIISEIITIEQLFEVGVECEKCSRLDRYEISTFEGISNIFLDDNIDDELS